VPQIKIQGIKKSFDQHHILRGVDYQVEPGESHVLFGTSGSGKSLLMKCIVGLIPPDQGSVQIDGEETHGFTSTQHTSLMDRVGMLFQYSGLFDSLPIWENVAFKLTNFRQMSRQQARSIAEEKLAAVGLGADVAALYPAEISGGMQKRVGLARAIAADPEIVFLDEPTAGLDPITSNRINDLIVRLVKDLKATAISITSDMDSARRISDHMAMLHEGKIIWSGATEELDSSGNACVHQFVNQLAEGPIKMKVRAA